MKILIKGTKTVKELSIVDAMYGLDWLADFISDGVAHGDFEWNEKRGLYECEPGIFDWWKKCIEDHKRLYARIDRLKETHSSDAIYHALAYIYVDLEDYAICANERLDKIFGTEEELAQ